MSIKFYNKHAQQWQKIASLLANSVTVFDIEGNYDSQTVEGCLQEIADALNNRFDDVECTSDGVLNFYSNGVIVKSVNTPTTRSGGTVSDAIIKELQKQLDDHEQRISWLEENGGGGGTGGNTPPTITSTFTETSFTTDDEIEIPYFLMDNQGGNFKAICSIDGNITEESATLGPNVWKVGVLPKGKHTLKIYIKDFSLFSNELVFNIVVGSLEITSNFREKDYGLNDNIVVNYDIESIGSDPIQVSRIIDGKETIVPGTPGRNTWSLGQVSKGPHKISLRAFTETATSNILNYSFTVTDADSLYVSTTFEEETVWNVENRLTIPYRISLLGGSKFKAHYTINGVKQPVADAALGMNFWDLGYPEIGEYDLTIQATNVAGTMESNIINLHVSVQATDFTPVRPVEDYLLCWFDAKGKSNAYEDREEWIDKSGNGVQAKLVDVNYSNNGWIDDGLRLNGDAYCEIDLQPFAEGVSQYGLTIDVQYKFNNSGNDEARVFSCELPVVPNTGVSIDSQNINLLGAESINQSANNEENLIRATFVIDPEIQRSYIYVNGVICNTALLSDSESYVHDSKIYLNAMRDENGEIINLSDCTIYNVRVYDKALTSEEVVQNHISDMKIEEQKIAVKRNTFTSLGQIDFDGDFTGMTADDQIPLRVAFSPNDGPGVKFDFPEVLVDWQGNSSLEYAIKNYNIDLIDEEGNSVDVKMKEDWPSHDSYHIKANMVDSSHAFNLGIAKLLPTIYTEPHPGIINNPDKGIKYAIDGFPVTCFHNGKFHGLYTFNLKQHRKVFGMDKNSTTQFMYRAEENSAMGAAAFRDSSNFSIEQEWEERHPKRPPGTGVDHIEFRRLINFVKDSSDAVFVRDLPRYFNKNYLLDYYLICYTFGGIDSLGKNMTLCTWDAVGDKSGIWYPMFYDMDTFFGFDNKGELVWGPDVRCPEDYNTSGSLLWERVGKLLASDIRARYAQLRRGGLNLQNVLNVLRGEIIDPIGEMFYNMDATDKYLSQGAKYLYMAKGNRVQHLERWLKARFLYVDSMFGFLPDVDNSIIIRNTCSGLWKIRIKTYTPQLIKVEFGGTGVGGQEPHLGTLTKMCNNKEWTEFSYFFDGVYQRDISISGAKYIIGLEGVAESETLMLDVSLCEKLQELDAHGNPNLTSINLSNCVRLRRLDLHDCPRLGSTTGTPLDVGNCYNLKYLDISNTAVPAITTTQCSYLTYVDISNSLISSIKYANLQSLKNLKIEKCSRLTSVTIENCQGITDLNISNDPALREVRIENCNSLKSININSVDTLTLLDIRDCKSLKTIKIRNAKAFKTIDLAGCEGLETFDAQGVQIETITFGEISTLKTLDLSKNTAIRAIDFGDCQSTIETFKISESDNLKYVDNLNLLISNYEQTQLFRNNDYIQRVTGKIKFGDDITSARDLFRGCIDLVEAPEIELNNVTILSAMFYECASLRQAPTLDTANVTDMSYLFFGCESLEEAPPYNTAKVENFSYMFYGCTSLIATYGYNIKSTKSLQGMFKGCSRLENVYDMNTSHITNFSEMFMDCSNIHYLPHFNTSSATNFYYFLDGCTQLRELPSFNTVNVTNFSRAFSRCEYLTAIPELDTSSAVNMSYMFYANYYLREINDMDMSHVTDISGMLESCINLTSVPEFNTAKVQNFNGLFRSCNMLTEVPELDTSSAIDIACMFWDCNQLRTIPRLNTTNVTKMYELFYGCTSLEEVPEFYTTDETMDGPTSKVTDMRGLFNGCVSLTAIPELDTANVIDFSEMFYRCNKITRVPRINFTKAKICSDMFNGCTSLTETPDIYVTNGSKPGRGISSMYGMFKDCKELTQVPEIDVSDAENLASIFEGCMNLSSIHELDTANCMYFNAMFRNCHSLESICDLDLRSAEESLYSLFEGCKSITVAPKLLNVSSKVTDFNNVFKNCEMLVEIPEIDLANATSISDMFRGCISLVDIPSFKNGTSKITRMDGTFSNCVSLTNIPELDTSNVVSATSMFNGCIALTTIPLLDFRSLKQMDYMFANCTALKTIPELNTSSVTSMGSLFSGCKVFSTMPLLDTRSVTNFNGTFRDCSELRSIPALDTSSATNMMEMFKNCTSLTTIPALETATVETVYAMFYGCSALRTLPLIDLDGVRGSAMNATLMLLGCTSLESCSFTNNRVSFDAAGLDSLTSIKFFNSARGITLNLTSNGSLTSEAIDEMFEALSTVEKGVINLSGSLGVYGCNSTIAENKGWTVQIDYSLPHYLKRYTR